MPDHTAAQNAAAARKNFAAARTMHRNLRLGRYQGRNSGGDSAYQMRCAAEAAKAAGRDLEGLLWAEHKLAERVSENADAGERRPELRTRLAGLRRELKEKVAA